MAIRCDLRLVIRTIVFVNISRDVFEKKFSNCTRLSDGKLELFTFEDLGVVNVEKVAIENSLNNTSENGNPVKFVLGVREVSIDPVRDIQSSVASKSEKVVCSNGFSLTGSLKHEKLRQDSHRFKPDGKGPENLGECVFVRDKNGKDGSTRKEVLHAKRVDIGIVGRLVRIGHEVNNVALRANKCDFEDKIVPAVGREYVCVAIVSAGARASRWRDDHRVSEAYQGNEPRKRTSKEPVI